ncbi:LytTR family DNA-binding domain-containing protein [Dysgonomonas sp. ZJ709]|uniref:LytR/AlgR family response regulator transcription factor n=1 Tax=Dysgonomonas sp. ZJ709 TaxID=2709797 RepID=UPI0013E9D9B0|nr:LytTR family DNA-binding domain-containing protein [Dysgonomonas sp. ZJ709]
MSQINRNIKYLIVEDEQLAYKELKRMISLLRPEYVLSGQTKTVEETISFLRNNTVDLIMLDIHLADGDSFEIFNQIRVATPIIFTTAYDEHAIKAFKLNSIDYLMKPIEEADLAAALTKYEELYQSQQAAFDYKQLENLMPQKVKNRFLIQKGDSFLYIEVSNIAFFYSEDKVCFLHTSDNKRYIIDYTLDQLEKHLDKTVFFRVSRNCITNIKAIRNISKYFNSRLKLSFQPECPHKVLVSRVRVNDFLKWVDGII